MMNIKRILSILLALVCVGVLVCSLCACDGEGSGEENEGGASSPFYVNYKNVKIELDKKAESVLEKLGEPKYSDNLGDCGGIGVQMEQARERIEQMVKYFEENNFQVIYAAPPEKINSIGSFIGSTVSLVITGRYTNVVEGLVNGDADYTS